MVEIWKERLTNQARTMIKKSLFSNFEIFEIHQRLNGELCQQDSNTVTKMLNSKNQEPSNRIET